MQNYEYYGSIATNSYSGNTATFQDQAGAKRQTTSDALGRVTQVIEDPGASPHVNYTTAYTYDVLDDLKTVSQGVQTRSFGYDSRQALLFAANPESGTVSYGYDADGNLTTRVDGRGVTTTYSYDALNRPTLTSYSDGTPTVGYTYDNNPAVPYSIGRLTQVTDGWSTTSITGYDPLGRVIGSQQILAGQTYNFAYGYNLANSLTSESYPSGRVVTTAYDLMNRVDGVAGVFNSVNTNYVTSATYAAHGAPSQYSYGNTLYRNYTYNSRLQPATGGDTVQNNPGNTHLYFTWNWGTSNNNGNLQSSVTSHGGPNYPQFLTFNDNYIYDGLNRLLASYDNDVNNNPLWARILSYDRYGNMSLVVNGGVPLYGTTPVAQNGYNPFNSATNRLVSGRFDAAGNQTEVGAYSLAYDAENRQTQAVDNVSEGQVAYGYDGAGQRVTKSNNGLVSTLYVYDIFGQLAAEYNSFPKQQSPCSTCYLSYDHLGSIRMVTDSAANIISRHDYLPFGEEIPANTAGRRSEWGPFGDKVNQKFTGQERDDETGFDFFQARYFYGAQGRFNSPDPGNAGADLTNPQTWNGYAYTRNNPLSLIDPTGTCSIKEGDTEATDDPGEPCVAPGDTSTTVNGGPPDQAPPDNSAPEYPMLFGQTPTFFDIAYGQPLTPQATGLLSRIAAKVCSALPQGRVMSVGSSIGGVGGQNGSLSVVINYKSGQVSGFATGGLQVGWNGIAQASVSTGFIYGALGPNNSGFSGSFTTGSGSGAAFGGYGSFGNGVQVYGGSLGASLTGATGTLSRTATSSPLQFGNILGSLAVTPLDNALSLARQAGCQ